ncbi:hypothetical protein BJX99DRAFT_263287 [Aspergillus californicus]
MADQPRLLQLPYHIRCQIYCNAGLISSDSVHPSNDVRPGEWSSREQKLTPHRHSSLPNQLFYVSRSVSEDARRVFFSENRFKYTHNKGRGLQMLFNLGPLACASLRSVFIRLEHRGCNLGSSGCHCKDTDFAEKDRLFRTAGNLDTWNRICTLLGSHITTDDQLSLYVICGATRKATAAAFLNTLDKLPRLKDLSIQLGSHRNIELLDMIQETIRRKTQLSSPTQAPFPLLKLPLELQIQVLEHTNLTASLPLRRKPSHHRFVPEDCYWGACNNIADSEQPWSGNWCSATESAISTVYPCLHLSDMRFIGNRHLRDLALQIYYSTNTFTVFSNVGSSESLAVVNTKPWTPETSELLKAFPQSSWSQLRHIHWGFRSLRADAFRVDFHGIRTNWVNDLLFIRREMPANRLTLEISLSGADSVTDEPDSAQAISSRWALYDEIVEPVACLRGHLRNLFIHNYCPAYYMWEDMCVNQEHVWERRIMGDDYDSSARGKPRTLEAVHDFCWKACAVYMLFPEPYREDALYEFLDSKWFHGVQTPAFPSSFLTKGIHLTSAREPLQIM